MKIYTFEEVRIVRRMFAAIIPDAVASLGEECVNIYLNNLKEKRLIWFAEESYSEEADTPWETIEYLEYGSRSSKEEWETTKANQISYANDYVKAKAKHPLLLEAAAFFKRYYDYAGYWPNREFLKQFFAENSLIEKGEDSRNYCTVFLMQTGAFMLDFDVEYSLRDATVNFDTLLITFDTRDFSESSSNSIFCNTSYDKCDPGRVDFYENNIKAKISDEILRRLGTEIIYLSKKVSEVNPDEWHYIVKIPKVVKATLDRVETLREPADFYGVRREPGLEDYMTGFAASFIDDPCSMVALEEYSRNFIPDLGDGEEVPW